HAPCSRDPPYVIKEQKVQISMLLRRRLAPVHGARSHVVDEFVMARIEPMFLALHVARDLGPLGRAIGVTERPGAVLLAFRCLHALGVANGARILDRTTNFLLIGVAQTAAAILNMIGEIKKAQAMALQQPRHSAQRGQGLALTIRHQSTNDVAKPRAVTVVSTGGELARQCHGSALAARAARVAHWIPRLLT